MHSLFEPLVELETSLHSSAVRKSKEKLMQLLHEDFMEIGASGRTYNKNQIMQHLLQEDERVIHACDFKLSILSPSVAQLRYRTHGENNTRVCLRFSIWILVQEHWQMIFHQGTVVSDNEV